MIQHRFAFRLIHRVRLGHSARWHLTYRAGDSTRIVATLDYLPTSQEWRLKSAPPPLHPTEAAWSHPAYKGAGSGKGPQSVPAWLQREVIAQLAAWGLETLDRLASNAMESGGAS